MERLNTSMVQHFNILRAWPEPGLELWKEFTHPTLDELKGKMVEFLIRAGFNTKSVELNEASCIVRSFEGDHFKFGESVFSFYGVFCYIRKDNQWISTTLEGQNFTIHPDKQIVPIRARTGELIEAEADRFKDLYLVIS